MARHGVTGRTADGKGTLKGQLVHCELVGVDQPPVSGESSEMATGSVGRAGLAPGAPASAAGTSV